MNIKDVYLDYLSEVKLMQLATVNDNKPWLCNVWYVMDDMQNVYWISRKTRRHSLDIEQNSHVACTFHRPFEKGFMKDVGQALVISGNAFLLQGEECEEPYKLYQSRFDALPNFQSLKAFLNDEGHHYFYKLVPEEIMWWDEKNFPDNPRQVIKGRL